MSHSRQLVDEFVLEPRTGKAIELRRDSGHVPEFENTPIREIDAPATLDESDRAALRRPRRDDLYGWPDGDGLRDIVFTWRRDDFLRGPHDTR